MRRASFPLLRRVVPVLLIGAAVVLAAAQTWSSWQASRRGAGLVETLSRVPAARLPDEKLRQELVELRLRNEEASSFASTLVRNFSVAVALLAAISGSWIAFHQYLQVRTRERLDRSAVDLNALWEGLSSPEQDRRAGSLAGLADFMTPDKEEFHDRTIAALALVGRMKNNSLVVSRTLTPLVEMAMRAHHDSAREISWQGLRLFRANLGGLQLANFDFRDADLEEAGFAGADLKGARFDAASLVGAVFDGANLSGAQLAYADLARATMRQADLRGADLRNVKLLDLDLEGADLRGAVFAPHATDWRLARNWRRASMDEPLRQQLIARYGPPAAGVRVAMLMWEYPPLVSGGGWTAVYHFLKNLRRHGADVVVFVPIPASVLDRRLFGNEIEVVGVGAESTVHSLTDHSAYAVPSAGHTDVLAAARQFQYGYAGRSLLAQVEAFQLHLLRAVDERRISFDVIHAHDWLTFGAAQALGDATGKPWIAHFHSLEADRQPGYESRHVQKVEAHACRQAAAVVAVSQYTAHRLESLYGADPARLHVVPNCLSDAGTAGADLGAFDTRRVVFLGRLTRQKGIDHFVALARATAQGGMKKSFWIFGDGEEKAWVEAHSFYVRRRVPAPQVVPPASEADVQYGVSLRLDALTAVTADGLTFAVHEEEAPSLRREIARRGFTATALVGSRFTHRITLAPGGDGLHPEYLAIASGLDRTEVRRRRFASLLGSLAWEQRTRAFDGATVLVVPSRSEPFGMVVLEAMRHGVAVMYPHHAGVGEVVRAGIRFDPENVAESAATLESLLSDPARWQATVEEQLQEVERYRERGYERLLQRLWADASAGIGGNGPAPLASPVPQAVRPA